jgi:methylisocitrate lyase
MPAPTRPTCPARCESPLTGRGSLLRRSVETLPLALPGAPFPLAAALAESLGFKAVYLSGGAMSAGLHAVPDIGLITLDELVTETGRLASACDLPVVVDADTGFGGPEATADCVRALEQAGAAAIQLEDQRLPKRCGHLAGKELIDASEMCEKLAAAREARSDPATVIIARSDARGVVGLDDAIARLAAYHEAGGDWLFPEALTNRGEFIRVAAELPGPLVANMTEFGRSPLLGREELASLGFAAVLYPVTLLRVAMKAMAAALAVIDAEGTQESLLDLMLDREELYALLDYDPAAPGRWLAAEEPR